MSGSENLSSDFREGLTQGIGFGTAAIREVLLREGVLFQPENGFVQPGVLMFYREDGSKGLFDLVKLLDEYVKNEVK